MGEWSSEEADSDLAHGVEIKAPSQDGQDNRDLDELLLAASQQFTGKLAKSGRNQRSAIKTKQIWVTSLCRRVAKGGHSAENTAANGVGLQSVGGLLRSPHREPDHCPPPLISNRPYQGEVDGTEREEPLSI